MVAAAVIGGAVVGGAVQAYGANKAAGTAADASTANQAMVLNAGQNAANMDLGAIDRANSFFDPYSNLGASSAGGLQNLLTGAQNGTAQQALENMPGYQFQKQQGLEATQNGFAARGLGSSGAAMKGAAQYVNGLTGTNLSNYYNMLLGGTQIGANAASLKSQNVNNLTTAASNAMVGANTNAASLGMAGANATAAGQAASYGAIGSGINNAANNYAQYKMLSGMGMYG